MITSAKDVARAVIDAMPEDATFDDVSEFLFEREMVERGRSDHEAGLVVSHDDVITELRKCLL